MDVALEQYNELKEEMSENQFQSLFSWMSLLNWDIVEIPRNYVSKFQSLFSWMSLLNDPDRKRDECHLRVSILVLVDVALELDGGGYRIGS